MPTNMKSKNGIIPVILSGGSGSRLWPLSRSSFPKQYLNLETDNHTLLQNTFLRLKGIKNLQDPIIICNNEQRFIVADQMKAINVNLQSLILEPFGRNTAPAVALASLKSIDKNNDPILLILSSDHKIKDVEEFHEAIEEAIKFALKGNIVTFGIRPNSPEVGYGYIESHDEISRDNRASKIRRFIEKPSLKVAKDLIKDNHFSWNSGMFVAKASIMIAEMERYEQQIIHICRKALQESIKDLDFIRIKGNIFKECPNLSIDVAVMEKTQVGKVIFLDAGWNDLGSWKSICEIANTDKDHNSLYGKTFVKDVKKSYLRSDKRLLVGLGIENILVVDTEDALLVANKESIDSLKDLVKELGEKNFPEVNFNKKVHRPWGNYTSVNDGQYWQVKRLEINPHESLSLQLHNYRSEHWIVVKGEAKVEIDGVIKKLYVNESIYVPKGAKHRLSNEGESTLILIEVQTGTYLGEDDIIRFEDKYRR